jgi:hypothetical protein
MRSAARKFKLGLVLLALAGLAGCAGSTSNNGNNSSGGNTSGGSNNNGSNTPPPTTSAIYVKASNTQAGDQFGFSLAMSSGGTTLAVGAPLEDSSAVGINGSESDNNLADAGAVYVYVNTGGTWVQEAYIKASNPGISDQFGTTVALSSDGNTLAVGTPLEDSNATGVNGNEGSNGASQGGAVYVFARSAGAWSQQAYIKASNTETGDQFGLQIALSGDGNTLAVGAQLEDSAAIGVGGSQTDNLAQQSGAVYVFTRTGTIWSQQAYIKASNTGADDRFGVAVALSNDGNTLAVGAHNEDSSAIGIGGNQGDNGAAQSGAVYVFTRSGGAWLQQAYIKSSDTEAGDSFGIAVSLGGNGNTLAVGDCCEDSAATGVNGNQADNSASGAGAVYVFTRAAGVWMQQAYVKSSNTGSGDEFGLPVALSNDGITLVAAAALEDSAVDQPASDNSVGGAGAAYTLARGNGTWTHQKFLKAPNTGSGDHFGFSLGVSGTGSAVAVGAPLEDSVASGINGNQSDNSAGDSGAVYVF